MKFKKLILATTSVLAVAALTGCNGNDPDALVDVNYQLAAEGSLKSGYTSLANANANAPIQDGKYTAGGKEFKVKDSFKTTYATEPVEPFFNYLTNQWTYNSRHYTNFIDGLVENDKYGNIVGAVALGYKTSTNSDGKQVWTFQLRENAEWVDNKTGKKVANVTANDFVAAAKYVLNPGNGSATANLYWFVDGAKAYYDALGNEEAADFNNVGVKALNDYELQYTLAEPAPYFITLLTYSPYLPVYQGFLDEEGTEFGKTVNDILINGSFRATTHEPENQFTYTKNFHYYDRDHVYVNHVYRKFVSGTMPLSTTREWYEAGLIDSFSVSAKDEVGYKNYVTGEDGTEGSIKNPKDPNCNGIQSYYGATFFGYFNYNRTFYAYNSPAHEQTDAEKINTAKAIWDPNFRLGFLYGLDACKGNEYRDPAEPFNWVVRNYVNKELVSYNGKDFSEYVTDIYNREQGTSITSLIGIDNGSDPIYNADTAKAYFQAAYDANPSIYPVYIDVPGDMDPEVQAYNEAMLAAVENASKLDGTNPIVKINWNIASSDEEDTQWFSRKMNFDLNMNTGWGPDYGDPKTYAATLIPFGDEAKYFGFPTSEKALNDITSEQLSKFLQAEATDLGISAKQMMQSAMDYFYGTESLGYYKLYLDADAIYNPAELENRYKAFAEAEYDSIYVSAMILPWYTANGYSASVSKTIPWQAGRSSYGLTEDKLKNVVVTDTAISKTDRAAITAEYNQGKGA